MIAPVAYGVKVMSIGFLIDEEQPMVWRGPMVTQALVQLLETTRWGELDYLIVDMPPGTGDTQLTLSQRVPVSGAVIVTTPQDIALLDARKGLRMFQKVEVPVLGVVENMSTHVCSNCGHEEHIFGAGGGERMARAIRGGPAGRAAARHPDPRTDRRRQADGRRRAGQRAGSRLPRFCARTAARLVRTSTPAFPTITWKTPELEPRRCSLSRNRAISGPRLDRLNARCQGITRSMSIKSDRWIRRMAAAGHDRAVRSRGRSGSANGGKIVSYGTSSYGYDVRCANEFKIFTNINSTIVDPKNFDPGSFVDLEADVCIIPPNSFALARTVEYFRIPRNVLTICLGKSTYARCGIIVNVTPLEPEWEGHVTLEFSNTTPLPAKIYANEGVAQMLFLESDEVCETSYKDRGGKYQGQRGVTCPKRESRMASW